MKSKIIDFKDLSSAREIVEHKIPNFMLWFFYFILIMITVLISWSYIGEKEIVVQATGMIETENIQSIVPLINSKVKEIYYYEGDYVKKGDLILVLDATEIVNNLSNYTKAKEDYEQNLVLDRMYLDSLNKHVNKFDLDNVYHVSKYYEFENYLSLYDVSEDKDKIKLEAIASTTKTIDSSLKTISQYHDEINKLESQLEDYYLYSNYDGVIHYPISIDINSSVQAGYELLKVYEQSEETYIAKLFVLNSDISKVEIGQEVRVEVSSLASKKYGYASATVVSIETTSRFDQNSGQSYYIVTAKLNESSLNDEEFMIGMQVKARMIVDTQKYIHYFIEKLELWVFE